MTATAVTRRLGGLCVLALALAYLATLTTQSAYAATIHACVKPKSGATRIVGAKAKCNHGEQKLAWNTTGPAGSKGQAGAQGAAGATGAQGTAGTNGAGALFSAIKAAPSPLSTTESAVVTKTIPPGSYKISAKTAVLGESEKTGFALVFCTVIDRPGTSNTGEATGLDTAVSAAVLGEVEPKDFIYDSTQSLEGTLTSPVTSTLSLACTADDTTGVESKAVVSQLQALAVTSIT